ncbi:hypothetical protein DBR06_SOUSAS28510002, partial [Sousa chinensis]
MSRSKHKGSFIWLVLLRSTKALAMETKVKITERAEQGEKRVDFARSYNMNPSTIGMIQKNKDKIIE